MSSTMSLLSRMRPTFSKVMRISYMSTTSSSTVTSTATRTTATATLINNPMIQEAACGNKPVTTTLNIVNTAEDFDKWPVFRVMDNHGMIIPGAPEPVIDKETAHKMYRLMGRSQIMDEILYNAQRQGRISFYMQNSGEEAAHIGSASALKIDDTVLAQYRELGVILWRGFTVQQCIDQCFSNISDLGKGRQMPVHYGSKELNFQTISSPLATQLPQAVGVAYSNKLAKNNAISIAYFGEGAASEGDFHAALNFAATLEAPMIFFCRNNGYAISTPTRDQYRGDGIISRAAGYGMHAIRVDGNDLFAVKLATEEARRVALEKNCPVLIEAMTYRRGHHSTSDDSTRYRSVAEIKHWQDNFDPVTRFRAFMDSRGWWSNEEEQEMRDSEKYAVLKALEIAENREKPAMANLFTDVYEEIPEHLLLQEESLKRHIEKYPEHYHGSSH